MKKSSVLMIVLAFAAVLIFAAGCGNKGPAPATDNSKCTKQQEVTVQVPYNETEFYYVETGIGRPHCAEEAYSEFKTSVTPLGKRCQIALTNQGNATGEFGLKAKFITTNSGGGPESAPVSKTVKPGQTEIFEFTYTQSDTPSTCVNACTGLSSANLGGCVVPLVEVCKYSFYTNETRTRTVTKFREEKRMQEVACK
jgi:predicted small lipoprotein YifL